MLRNDKVLARRYDAHDDARSFARDDGGAGCVAVGIELDAQMLQAQRDLPTYLRRALTDPAGEDERIQPAERRAERAGLLLDLVNEEFDRLGGRRIVAASLQQRAHVVADARHSEQAAALGEHVV